MKNLFQCLLVLSFSVVTFVARANQCSDFLKKDHVERVAQELVSAHSLYSPWYYDFLKERATNEEILSAFAESDDARLNALAGDVYELLVSSERLEFNAHSRPQQIGVLFKSLKAIQKTGRFPMQVEVKRVTKRGKVWASRGAVTIGGTSLFLSFFMPASDFSSGLMALGAGATVVGGLGFLDTTKELIVRQVENDVVTFILSEGSVDSLINAHSRYSNKKGVLIESNTSYKVVNLNGEYLVVTDDVR